LSVYVIKRIIGTFASMNIKRLFYAFLIATLCVLNAFAGHDYNRDGVLRRIQAYPDSAGRNIAEFNATEYIKFKMVSDKKNRMIDILPHLFRLQKGKHEYIAEAISNLHFTSPDTWNRKTTALTGTLPHTEDMLRISFDYTSISVYGRTLLQDKMLSPLHPLNKNYYYYHIDNIHRDGDKLLVKIRFKSKNHNPQLVNGYAWVDWQTGAVRKIYFKGKYDLMNVRISVDMDSSGIISTLPTEIKLNADMIFMKNRIQGTYYVHYDYHDLKQEVQENKNLLPHNQYDLTGRHTLHTDFKECRIERAKFDSLRPVKLADDELFIYNQKEHPVLDTMKVKKRATKGTEFWGFVGDALLNKHTLSFRRSGILRFAPIITPAAIQYSPRRGLALCTDFRYTKLFANEQVLSIKTKFGFNFKERRIYWSIPASFEYWPKRRGFLTFEVGNGNHIYSSEIVDELKHDIHGNQMPDSITSVIDSLRLGVYSDIYFKVDNRFELCNGLTLNLGAAYHNRTIINRNNIAIAEKLVKGDIKESYRSFSPHIKLTWTPCQYYYYDGKIKKNLYSRLPTFSVDYERGFKIDKCDMRYAKWEFNAEYRLKMWELRSLSMRAGGGFYDLTRNTYFVDFTNFNYRSLPDGWDDDLSGQFQLLNSHFYNSSKYYANLCMTYESPMMILTRIKYLTNFIQTERIYVNTLMVDRLHPYLECGYGIGTMLGNAGAYISFANGHFDAIGFRIAFEILR
jgi:hypothetical protein